MKNTNIQFLAALLFIFGCDEMQELAPVLNDNQEATATYIIPAGAHYCKQSKYEKVRAGSLKFRAYFDNSAVYQTKNKANQADINKLYGMSDCGTTHQTNSARFGWVWNNNKLEIWAYVYTNGQRKHAFVDSVSLNVYHTYEISFTESSYVFKLNNTAVELLRNCNGPADGYKLYPYFGGDESAPHEVTIIIEDLD